MHGRHGDAYGMEDTPHRATHETGHHDDTRRHEGIGHYGRAALERWVPEPDKRPGRTAFQRDRARVLHSAALRRLAGKTQVVAPGGTAQIWDASPRTR
ncbi:MAG TPA: deoxyguanosinetriphosphate triphosphohydrolase, partial [Streptomyces sp.]|nr:deoxyguanosinetriphosphate triphosphohydrolase [Streptomyces sp.]